MKNDQPPLPVLRSTFRLSGPSLTMTSATSSPKTRTAVSPSGPSRRTMVSASCGIAPGQPLGGLAQLDHQPLLGRLEGREAADGLGIAAQQAREAALEQRLGRLLDPPAGPRQLVGPADELLEALPRRRARRTAARRRGARPRPRRRP